MASLPSRPRLADHALPRRHVVDGREQVVIFDQRTGGVVVLEPATWDVLQAADGTRDLEGIRLAARRAGASARPQEIARMLEQLADLELIAGSTERRGPPRVVVDDDTPRTRPLEVLPGLRLCCDQSGACCRNYATVMMTTAEKRRALTLLPEHRVGPVTGTRLFTPIAGTEPGELWCATHRDGACGYLDDDGRCALHRVGGPAGKPFGCAQFPVTFVDDGTTVRVSVKTECACVLHEVPAGEGDPLVDPTWTTAADLPRLTAVHKLPAEVPVSESRALSRAELRAFVDAWVDAPAPGDVATAAWAMGEALQARGPDAALRAWSTPTTPSPAAVATWIAALQARASRRARDNARWRSPHDRVRIAVEQIAAAALVARDPDVVAELVTTPSLASREEALYLRAAAFGYALVDRRLDVSLRDRAVRIWLARAMTWIGEAAGASLRQPLATVDAMLRAYGIGNYVDEVDTVDDLLTTSTAASPPSRRD